ncbi:MAG: S1 RNA-binding domain-containing protein, partial [Planctomycetota bacterium]
GLLREDGHLLRTRVLPARGDGLADRLKEFLGDAKPSLVAIQSDPVTRGIGPPLLQALRADGAKVRSASVPLSVVKTLLREVARRPDETHLTHDERQALLLARLAWTPRAAAFHTPHIVRAYIPGRSEINARRLEEFERTFLRHLLLRRGVEANHAPPDQLRLVPGLDAEGLVRERSTAPFRSLEDLQARMGLSPQAWRAACCFLRVRDSDQVLDSRPIHPFYYHALETLAAKSGLPCQDLMKDPARVKELDWEPLLKERGWAAGVVDQIRIHLGRSARRPRRPHKGREGQRLEALEVGAVLRGTVSALLPYGAFVDVGARREGLVHISEMADRFVNDPGDIVQVGQEVRVRVLSIDVEHQRFRLSMRQGDAREEGRGEGRESGPARKPSEAGSPQHAGPPAARDPAGRTRGPERGRAGERGRKDSREGRESRGRRERPGRARVRSRRDEFDPYPKDGKQARKDPDFNLDPRKEGEEIDPNNPFFKFFQKNKDVVKEEKDGKAGSPSS